MAHRRRYRLVILSNGPGGPFDHERSPSCYPPCTLMRLLSATDAITPAWRHTRTLLAPLRWRTVLKVAAIAFLAQLGGFNFNLSAPGRTHLPRISPAVAALFIGIAVVAAIVALVLGLIFFYLGSRSEFVLFDIVLRRDTTVAPIWRRFGPATWPWMGLKLLFFLLAILCIAPVAVPTVIHFIHANPFGPDMAPQDFAKFFAVGLGFIFAIFIIVLVVSAVYVLLRDFGLPSMALEATSLRETVARVRRLCRAEPGQVLLYLLLRFGLVLAGALAGELVIFLGALIALIPLGALAAILWVALRHAGLVAHIVMVGGWIVLGLVLLAAIVLAGVILFGILFCFLQAYALYFLGGRYPLVGQYLEPLLPHHPTSVPPYGLPPYATPPPPPN